MATELWRRAERFHQVGIVVADLQKAMGSMSAALGCSEDSWTVFAAAERSSTSRTAWTIAARTRYARAASGATVYQLLEPVRVTPSGSAGSMQASRPSRSGTTSGTWGRRGGAAGEWREAVGLGQGPRGRPAVRLLLRAAGGLQAGHRADERGLRGDDDYHLGEAASVGFGTVPFWHVSAPPAASAGRSSRARARRGHRRRRLHDGRHVGRPSCAPWSSVTTLPRRARERRSTTTPGSPAASGGRSDVVPPRERRARDGAPTAGGPEMTMSEIGIGARERGCAHRAHRGCCRRGCTGTWPPATTRRRCRSSSPPARGAGSGTPTAASTSTTCAAGDRSSSVITTRSSRRRPRRNGARATA